jgi:hypothetical protein
MNKVYPINRVYPPVLNVEYTIKDVVTEKKGPLGSKRKQKAGIPTFSKTPVRNQEVEKGPETRSLRIAQKSILVSKSLKLSKDDIDIKLKSAAAPSSAAAAFVVHIPGLPKRPSSAVPSKRIDPQSKIPEDDTWDYRSGIPDRDQMIIEQDLKISLFRFNRPSTYDTTPQIRSSPHMVLKDEKERRPKKDKSDYVRDRMPARTFTGILNNPFPQYPHLHDEERERMSHGDRWNFASNTDELYEPKRFLPSQRGKSRDEFRKDFRIKNTKKIDFVETLKNVSSVKSVVYT